VSRSGKWCSRSLSDARTKPYPQFFHALIPLWWNAPPDPSYYLPLFVGFKDFVAKPMILM
jgi:hypothetical protein